jgi:hypothetical protein
MPAEKAFYPDMDKQRELAFLSRGFLRLRLNPGFWILKKRKMSEIMLRKLPASAKVSSALRQQSDPAAFSACDINRAGRKSAGRTAGRPQVRSNQNLERGRNRR